MKTDYTILCALLGGLASLCLIDALKSASAADIVITVFGFGCIIALIAAWCIPRFGAHARERIAIADRVQDIPEPLKIFAPSSVLLGQEFDLHLDIWLPNAVRLRHVHILGATGSGKTESVIFNLLKQDTKRGFGAIILDAKGDKSFLEGLKAQTPEDRLQVFDLAQAGSLPFNPLASGGALEAAQRLFSSLIWSEEYYKSKALSMLQTLFESHHRAHSENPSIAQIGGYLASQKTLSAFLGSIKGHPGISDRDFADLSGLRDQVRTLSVGHLSSLLSPASGKGINLDEAGSGKIQYFRLQSLLSPALVTIVGRLILNCMAYQAGTAHRTESSGASAFTPVYLDEFASFASPEFADLISKARSAGFALHFSHQSVGDLKRVSESFLSQVTDNSATKIVLRVNDPDSAEYFSRAFGTKQVRKVTQRVSNSEIVENAESDGVGSMREVQQFRASPDLLKTLPTGEGAVLIAHGYKAPQGASSVFRIKFPHTKGER